MKKLRKFIVNAIELLKITSHLKKNALILLDQGFKQNIEMLMKLKRLKLNFRNLIRN